MEENMNVNENVQETVEKTPKMTQREFFTAIAEMHEGLNPELVAYAESALAKLNERNEKNRAKEKKPSAKALENAKLAQKLYDEVLVEDKVMTASEIGEIFGISSSKATAILKVLVNEEKVTVSEVKGKKGKVKGYTKA